MNNTLKDSIIFIVGAAIGSAITYKIVKDKYAAIADEEIASVKELYSKKEAPVVNQESKHNVDSVSYYKYNDSDSLMESAYNDIVSSLEYSYKKGGTENDKFRPYVISPDEFGEIYDYESSSLTYYSDGVLCDENDEPIEDIDKLVGKDFYIHFGEYEDDSVFIRNDSRECDYEILKDARTYTEVVGPYPVDE